MNSFAPFPFKSRPTAAIIAAVCVLLTLPVLAQDKPTPEPINTSNSANPASTSTFAFEVVSIKPYKQTGDGVSMSMNTSTDGFTSRGFSLKSFLFNAFPIVMPDQLVGLPPWADSDYYEVDAKMDEETAAAYKKLPRDQGRQVWHQMMQDLLADRFELKFHKETRELPIYNLVVAKGGLKIQPTPSDNKNSGYSMNAGKLSGTGIALDSLAFSLSGAVGRMIVNKTGLTGGYNIELKWQPDAMQAGSNSSAGSDALPDLFTALQEQAGLKLEPAKGPVDVYVIDHVEKPSEN